MNKILLLTIALTTLWSCNNDDDNAPANPIDLLPPATQIGANTFGCLLDGEPFLPGNGPNPLDCTYQFVSGGYYLTLQANKRDALNNRITIALGTNELEIVENQVYSLMENQPDTAHGIYSYASNETYTSQEHFGELTITKLDMANQVVSGTFFFDIEDQNGVVHEIRDGRFDMHFTQ